MEFALTVSAIAILTSQAKIAPFQAASTAVQVMVVAYQVNVFVMKIIKVKIAPISFVTVTIEENVCIIESVFVMKAFTVNTVKSLYVRKTAV